MAEDRTTETWNMATATMQRFNNLLLQSSIASQQGNLNAWFNILMDLRRNLFPFMSDTIYKQVTKKLNALPKDWRYNKISFPLVNKTFDELYMIFIKIMKDKGLLMPKTLDTTKAVIDM